MNSFNANDYVDGQLLKIQLNPGHLWFEDYPTPFIGRVVDATRDDDDCTCMAVEPVLSGCDWHYIAVSSVPTDAAWHGEILEVISEEE